MRKIGGLLIIIISLLLVYSCNNTGSKEKPADNLTDTISVPDTGYTGIKQFMSNKYLVSEVTFKNGVRNGLMKSFYASGKLRQTFWYENGLREDSAKWYYEEGQVFRSTPYINDTVDGMQIQYYRNGKIKARLEYKKGLRTPFLEEFSLDGKLVGGYPEIIINVKDEYQSQGRYDITLQLSDKSKRVKYYQGEFLNNVFDTTQYKTIKTVQGIGYLSLKKSSSATSDYVGVIAEIITNFGNKNLVYKKIGLPYSDLN
jgi:antitoxin component YwqK of YwqJK toxin-antitoxin module